jgi:hypothetical protein
MLNLSASVPCISVVLTLAIAASGNCRADTIVLRDGSEHEGEIIRETPVAIIVQKRLGSILGTVEIPKAEIVGIKVKGLVPDRVLGPGVTLEKEAEATKGESDKVAEAWVRVGEYYGHHAGYSAKAREAFEKALALDANQPVARAKLGFVKENGKWIEATKPVVAITDQNGRKDVARADEITIGLRRDDELVKKIQDEQAARQRMEAEIEHRLQEMPQNGSFTSYGYSRDYYIAGPSGSLYAYSPYDGGYTPVDSYCAPNFRTVRRSSLYGGNTGGYYGVGLGYANGYGFDSSSSYYNSGYGFSGFFSGKSGNVQFRGAVNPGGFRGGGSAFSAGFNSGAMRFGF